MAVLLIVSLPGAQDVQTSPGRMILPNNFHLTFYLIENIDYQKPKFPVRIHS